MIDWLGQNRSGYTANAQCIDRMNDEQYAFVLLYAIYTALAFFNQGTCNCLGVNYESKGSVRFAVIENSVASSDIEDHRLMDEDERDAR